MNEELIKKEKQSLQIIKGLYDEKKENILAFSGGKDSVAIYHLAKLSGLKFRFVYTNTTIDPPGHINFIRKNYPDVEIIQPKLSFYQVVAKYGLPTRQHRFCCQHLKEYVGKDAKVFEGLRIDEGVKRGKRLKELKEPESCDTRLKGKIHVYPIMYWTTKDVWDYIKENNLPYSEWYDKGFDRLGCIGCPLVSKARIREYKMFPRYVYAVIKAIDKNIKAEKGISKFFQDPYEAFYWWISEMSIKNFQRKGFFETNYEEVVKKMFPLCKQNKNL
jgi:phosphoadenosine phosphosulfate reductase